MYICVGLVLVFRHIFKPQNVTSNTVETKNNMEKKSYYDLLKEGITNSFDLTYQDKLSTSEWQDKREEIICRDNNHCTKCEEPKVILYGKGIREMNQSEKDEHWEKVSQIPNLPITLKKERVVYPRVPVQLHVHHKYYILNKLPWEYENNALVTLCDLCHTEVHRTEKILVYKDDTKSETTDLTVCRNCNGSGYLSHYKYYMNGVCFSCSGTGYLELK